MNRVSAENEGRPDEAPIPQLDDVDLQILRLLRIDARRSARAVAREVGMSAGAVTERLARLENSGVIRGYHADVDPLALGYRMRAFISIQLRAGIPTSESVNFLLEQKEIIGIYLVTGRWDLVLLVQVPNQEHLHRNLLTTLRTSCPGIERTETMLILERHAPGAQSAIAHTRESQ
jgi:Lrp/AsnC family leucine-responsive transcriptional regulator